MGLGGFVESLLKATSSTGTAIVVAFAILIVAAWCFRRMRLEHLATGPGRIEVPDFSVMTDDEVKVDAVHMTALFRQRLATLRLQSPAPVPGSAPASDFLEVLGGNGVGRQEPARHAAVGGARGQAVARVGGAAASWSSASSSRATA